MAKLWIRMEKFKKYIHVLCNALELIAAGLMLVGIVLTVVGIFRNAELFSHLLTDTSQFREYMEQILMLVIGVEFLVMLCRPNSENVMEVLIFLGQPIIAVGLV